MRTSLAMAALLLAAACNSHTGPSEDLGVTLYEHPGFGGQSRTLDGNVFDLDDIRGPCFGFFGSNDVGDWDDCASSIRVPPGWEATIYEHDEYEGEFLILGNSVPDLDHLRGPCGNDWDDCISSIRIHPPLR